MGTISKSEVAGRLLSYGRRVLLRGPLGMIRGGNSKYFNLPVKKVGDEWYVNERLVEMPFVLQALPAEGIGKRVLEFGCTRSWLALQLAALGYEVTAIDLRPYPLTHPNLEFLQSNVLDYHDESGFDVITAVSVIEHIGLGAYGEASDSGDLQRVADKLVSLLRANGRLIVTLPMGMPYQDDFLRSFTPAEIHRVFGHDNLQPMLERYFRREEGRVWRPANLEEIGSVDNSRQASGPTGVNGVGCFVWLQVRNPVGRECTF
jgi:SAM-dependent methyltransferase